MSGKTISKATETFAQVAIRYSKPAGVRNTNHRVTAAALYTVWLSAAERRYGKMPRGLI